MVQREIEFGEDEISDAARWFWDFAARHRVLAFSGDLGAGKTTFIGELCRQVGVEEIVSSPTFSIIQQYQSNTLGTIYHMDLYRIKDEEEAINAGVEDYLNSGNYCMIEWPERAAGILPDSTLWTEIIISAKNRRKLRISPPHENR